MWCILNIFIAEPSNKKAILALSALARAMKEMNKVAIVRCVWRQGQGNVVVGVPLHQMSLLIHFTSIFFPLLRMFGSFSFLLSAICLHQCSQMKSNKTQQIIWFRFYLENRKFYHLTLHLILFYSVTTAILT